MNDTGTLGNIIYKIRVKVIGGVLHFDGTGICTVCGAREEMKTNNIEDQIFNMAADHLHIPIDINKHMNQIEALRAEVLSEFMHPPALGVENYKYGDLNEGPF